MGIISNPDGVRRLAAAVLVNQLTGGKRSAPVYHTKYLQTDHGRFWCDLAGVDPPGGTENRFAAA